MRHCPRVTNGTSNCNGSGPIGDFIPDYQEYGWDRDLTSDHWVWIALALRDNQSISVVIDYVDGTCDRDGRIHARRLRPV